MIKTMRDLLKGRAPTDAVRREIAESCPWLNLALDEAKEAEPCAAARSALSTSRICSFAFGSALELLG
jgi:hypothetical protein